MSGSDQPQGETGPGGRDRGFRARKREDHTLLLIEELKGALDDLPRVRRLLLQLGRHYDPVLGGAILDLPHQRAIVEALEAGRPERALGLIEERYALYVQHRIHLGGDQERARRSENERWDLD